MSHLSSAALWAAAAVILRGRVRLSGAMHAEAPGGRRWEPERRVTAVRRQLHQNAIYLLDFLDLGLRRQPI